MYKKKSTLGFYGGVGDVTGANFLLDTGDFAMLIDCGLVQGNMADVYNINAADFVYNPADIDVLFVTHAHADHIGRIPKLMRDGFRGVIYSTPPTKDLAALMLMDALHIMEMEAVKLNRDSIYDNNDVQRALAVWKTLDFNKTVNFNKDITVQLLNSGHILGSAMIEVERNGRRIIFTGDIGNVPQPLLSSPTIPSNNIDYILMESVYGDRVHEDVSERSSLLKFYIEDTVRQNGTLLIPAFSLERTQGILLEINNLVENKMIPPIKTFLDSPLAIKVTGIYAKYAKYMKKSVFDQIKAGDDIFMFEGMSFTETVKESSQIERTKGPKIIIAGAGMSHGGRIRTHEKKLLKEPTTTLLMVGYQSVGSLGRRLQDGAKFVWIDGEKIEIKAKIETIRGFSGHADRNQLLDFVGKISEKHKPERVFVTMGEEKSSLFLAQRIYDYLDIKSVVPMKNDEIEIDF